MTLPLSDDWWWALLLRRGAARHRVSKAGQRGTPGGPGLWGPEYLDYQASGRPGSARSPGLGAARVRVRQSQDGWAAAASVLSILRGTVEIEIWSRPSDGTPKMSLFQSYETSSSGRSGALNSGDFHECGHCSVSLIEETPDFRKPVDHTRSFIRRPRASGVSIPRPARDEAPIEHRFAPRSRTWTDDTTVIFSLGGCELRQSPIQAGGSQRNGAGHPILNDWLEKIVTKSRQEEKYVPGQLGEQTVDV